MVQTLENMPQTAGGGSTKGKLNYLSRSVAPSLLRNGKVFTKRDGDGSDSGTYGMELHEQQVEVRNARLLGSGDHLTCEANGFELMNVPLDNNDLNFFDHSVVVHDYYKQCTRLVTESTGGRAFAFDHNIRSATGKRSRKETDGGQPVQEPIHLVHGDYTLTSAPQRLCDLTRPPSVNDTLRTVLADGETLIDPADASRAIDGGRFAIINVWRNIADTPIEVHPLALCDSRTVDPKDLVVFEIHYQDRIGENYFARHSPDHCWYYYPQMTRDEPLLIKQWDSAGAVARTEGERSDATDDSAPCTFSFHTAFEDPGVAPDAPDRWSIEVRCMVIYD